jgi:integrase
MNIKRICQFILERERDKPDAKLRYRIKWKNSKNIVAFNLGYRIDVAKWSVETQRCKNNTTHGKKKVAANIINREIQRFEDAAFEAFSFFEKLKQTPNPDELRNEFNKIIGRAKSGTPISFFDVFDEYTKTVGSLNSWNKATYTKHNAIKSHLMIFNNALSFETLSEETLMDFIKYLQSTGAMQMRYKKSERGMRNTTISKNIDFIKSFLRWAHYKKFYGGDLHETFKPKFKGLDIKEVVYLSWEELERLYNFKFQRKSIEQTRDVFCFMCFTSLRYSDVAKLKRSDIKPEHIHVVTKKTVDGLKIELNKYSRAILEKYKNEDLPNDRVLPVVSNTKMNIHLKSMAKEVGFNEKIRVVYFTGNERHEEVHPKYELITAHCGRRTFIVNSLYLGIPAEVVMSWTGHSDYESMKPYIKIVDGLKEKSMKKFDDIF